MTQMNADVKNGMVMLNETPNSRSRAFVRLVMLAAPEAGKPPGAKHGTDGSYGSYGAYGGG